MEVRDGLEYVRFEPGMKDRKGDIWRRWDMLNATSVHDCDYNKSDRMNVYRPSRAAMCLSNCNMGLDHAINRACNRFPKHVLDLTLDNIQILSAAG